MDLPFREQRSLESVMAIFNKLRDPSTQGWIFLNPTSIGDTMIVCALMKSFREKFGGPISMIVSQKQVPLIQMYAHRIDRAVTLSFNELEQVSVHLAGAQVFCKDQPFVVHPFWHSPGQWERFFELFRFPGRGGLSISDIFRFILRLDWDAPFDMPVIPPEWKEEAVRLAQQAGMVPGKSVILFPDNNSNPGFPMPFWEQLAAEFTKQGLAVFTNMAGNNKGGRAEPIRNTRSIDVTVRNAIPLVELAGRYVSGVNGLASMMDIARVNSLGTVLVYGKPFRLNSFDVNYPIPYQSARYHGFSDRITTEFLVDPDAYTDLIPDIASNNQARALVW